MKKKEDTGLEPLPASVVAVEGLLTTEELELKERLTQMQDDSWVLHEVIVVWRGQSDSERSLRRLYANAMLIALCVEAVFASVMFVVIITRNIPVSPWVANVFFATVYGQIAAGTLAITKYLFPPTKADSLIGDLLRLRQLAKEKRTATRSKKRG